jgi:TPR repeat protein
MAPRRLYDLEGSEGVYCPECKPQYTRSTCQIDSEQYSLIPSQGIHRNPPTLTYNGNQLIFNDAITQFGLGNLYQNGQSLVQDHELAVDCYRKAAEQGHDKAKFNLGYSNDISL